MVANFRESLCRSSPRMAPEHGKHSMKPSLRAIALTSLIAGAVWGLPAAAQNYPTYGQPPVYASPPYPGAPADDDDVIVPGPRRDSYVYGSRSDLPQPGAPYGTLPPASVGTQEAHQVPYGAAPEEGPTGAQWRSRSVFWRSPGLPRR